MEPQTKYRFRTGKIKSRATCAQKSDDESIHQCNSCSEQNARSDSDDETGALRSMFDYINKRSKNMNERRHTTRHYHDIEQSSSSYPCARTYCNSENQTFDEPSEINCDERHHQNLHRNCFIPRDIPWNYHQSDTRTSNDHICGRSYMSKHANRCHHNDNSDRFCLRDHVHSNNYNRYFYDDRDSTQDDVSCKTSSCTDDEYQRSSCTQQAKKVHWNDECKYFDYHFKCRSPFTQNASKYIGSLFKENPEEFCYTGTSSGPENCYENLINECVKKPINHWSCNPNKTNQSTYTFFDHPVVPVNDIKELNPKGWFLHPEPPREVLFGHVSQKYTDVKVNNSENSDFEVDSLIDVTGKKEEVFNEEKHVTNRVFAKAPLKFRPKFKIKRRAITEFSDKCVQSKTKSNKIVQTASIEDSKEKIMNRRSQKVNQANFIGSCRLNFHMKGNKLSKSISNCFKKLTNALDLHRTKSPISRKALELKSSDFSRNEKLENSCVETYFIKLVNPERKIRLINVKSRFVERLMTKRLE